MKTDLKDCAQSVRSLAENLREGSGSFWSFCSGSYIYSSICLVPNGWGCTYMPGLHEGNWSLAHQSHRERFFITWLLLIIIYTNTRGYSRVLTVGSLVALPHESVMEYYYISCVHLLFPILKILYDSRYSKYSMILIRDAFS